MSESGAGERGGDEQHRLVRAGKIAWSLLGLIGLLVLGWYALSYVSTVVVPVVLAVFAAAALSPVVRLLTWLRIPRPLAAFLSVLAAFALVGGVVSFVVPSVVAQLPQLGNALIGATKQFNTYISNLPFVGPNVEVRSIAAQAAQQFFGNSGSLPAALGTVVSILGAVVLLIVILLFYLAEGQWLVAALVSWLPASRRNEVWQLAVDLWQIVGRYFRAVLAVALFDAVFIGLGLFLLDVPLALPLAVLVYFGAFLPYVGAIVSGLVAVLVAFAERGLVTALLVLGVVILVQQLEGNVIQPLVMGKLVRLPAFVVLVAIAIGASLLGILGAFLAVPVAACLEHLLKHFRDRNMRASER